MIPLSLYIHIPWCVRKCPYCDFNSHAAKDFIPEDLYVNVLLKDLDTQLNLLAERPLISIFFGGGTPSLFSPVAIKKILDGVKNRLPFAPNIEITLEANPGTLDESRFTGFYEAGLNRVSIGIQSLQNEKLQQLGRIHSRDHALGAIEKAYKAGFQNINIDLMHGLPNQSVADAISDLHDAFTFQTPHLSWYQLTIEPNTFFHHQPPALPKDEILWEIQEAGKKELLQQGFNQYEVSAYCRLNKECIHNRNYWEFGDYLGIGAGAHSKITLADSTKITRFSTVKHPKDYLSSTKNLIANSYFPSESDLVFEFMLNALRLNAGVPLTLFTERTGLNLSHLEPALSIAKNKKLLQDDDFWLKPTELGQRFLNDLTALFLTS